MQVGKRGAENRGESNMYISPLYLISFVKIYKIYPLLLSHGVPSGWKKEILGFFPSKHGDTEYEPTVRGFRTNT